MKLSDFDYDLPAELIANYPVPDRTASRLLCVRKGSNQFLHQHFYDLVDFLKPNDILVFNNSRVIKARLFGVKSTGGQVEVLVERIIKQDEVLAHLRASKTPKPGGVIHFEKNYKAEVLGRVDDLFHLRFLDQEPVLSILEKIGHMPLPPYMNRPDEDTDEDRYQTVYAKVSGSVAAPTAGLHFDLNLLNRLRDKGVLFAEVTLHVGAGTFQPVRVENIKDHRMHSEWIDVEADAVHKINQAKANGGRVIAVGTTSVRSLETASQSGRLEPYQGETSIFIYPGYQFKMIDMLITNFHLPQSSLLMLVSALAGVDTIKSAYSLAIQEGYRFFSYGDAMLIYA